MLDESLLDSPEALTRADTHDLLRGAAEAGARVRTGARRAAEAGLADLRPEGRPRGVLVAGSGTAASCAADLLGALAGGALPVTLIRPTGPLVSPEALSWTLPGWAGPVDLVLVATADGTETGLAALVDQAYRRGCSVVAVSPPESPLAGTVGHSRGLNVPLAPPVYAPYAAPTSYEPTATGTPGSPAAAAEPGVADSLEIPGVAEPPQPLPAAPGELWALLAPFLMLADRLGLFPAGRAVLDRLADRLDQVAERCGPAIELYSNPAKSLATELADALPLLWSEGGVAGAAARHAATALTALAGRPALAAPLPEALGLHGALLEGAFGGEGGLDDFFRDRVEEPDTPRARILLLHDGETGEPGPYGASGEPGGYGAYGTDGPRGEPGAPEGPGAGASALDAARDLAHAHGTPVRELAPDQGSSPIEAAAELIATADFAAVYLVLAAGDA